MEEDKMMFSSRDPEYDQVPTNEEPTATQPQTTGRRKWGVLCCAVMATAILLAIGKYREVAHERTPGSLSVETYPVDGNVNLDAPWPRIAWLMSFPNSGTSFTMKLIQRVSNLTAATNYGKECEMHGLATDGTNIPLYKDIPDGPFLLSPNIRSVPERYVMTKTHCGGRCNSCAPHKYILGEDEFLDWCLRGGKLIRTENGDGTDFVNVHYNTSLVHRAIHLIRDPFDNVVSNFHLEQHEKKKKNDSDWLGKYPNNPEGFQRWCAEIDARFTDEEKKSDELSDGMLKIFEKVPCHGDFYRFAQWHSLALKVIKKTKLPTLVLHYENYGKDYEKSVEELLGFLELPRNGELPEFIAGKSYKEEFFTEHQRNATMALVRSVSSQNAWELLKRYDSSS